MEMTFKYVCPCGSEIKIHTDEKPPRSVKCFHCKKKAYLEGTKMSERIEDDSKDDQEGEEKCV